MLGAILIIIGFVALAVSVTMYAERKLRGGIGKPGKVMALVGLPLVVFGLVLPAPIPLLIGFPLLILGGVWCMIWWTEYSRQGLRNQGSGK